MAIFAVFKTRMKQSTRYRGYWGVDIAFTFLMAGLPILMGRGFGSQDVFGQLTGTSNYPGYMLLGACAFMIIDAPLWQMGFWFRREQMIGTLQSIYLVPNSSTEVLAGVCLFSCFRSFIIIAIPLATGIIFLDLPLGGGVLLGLAFLIVGSIPVCGMSLMVGAIVLRLKEVNSVIGTMQWALGLLMGVYCQIAIFPLAIRAISYCIPMTWINYGLRGSIMGIPYLLGEWYQDLAIVVIFCIVMPIAGFLLFRAVERSVKRKEGVNLF